MCRCAQTIIDYCVMETIFGSALLLQAEKERIRATHALLLPLFFASFFSCRIWSSFFNLCVFSIFNFRLSIPNMEDLKRKLLKIVSNCNRPKVRTTPSNDLDLLLREPLKTPSRLCFSTAFCCRGVGTSSSAEIPTTSPPRWTTGGRRS